MYIVHVVSLEEASDWALDFFSYYIVGVGKIVLHCNIHHSYNWFFLSPILFHLPSRRMNPLQQLAVSIVWLVGGGGEVIHTIMLGMMIVEKIFALTILEAKSWLNYYYAIKVCFSTRHRLFLFAIFFLKEIWFISPLLLSPTADYLFNDFAIM